MADLFTHQLWVNKKGDLNGQILSLQFTNTEAKVNLKRIIEMWTRRGYEYTYETIYNYCPDECRTKSDIKLDVDLSDGIMDNDSIIKRMPVNIFGDMHLPKKQSKTNLKRNKMAATKMYNVNGKDQSLKQLAKSSGINIATLRARVARGIKGDALIASSVRGGSSRAKTFEIAHADGSVKSMTLKEIAKMANSPVATIRARVARGLVGMNLITGNNPMNKNRGKTFKVTDGSVNMELTINEIASKYNISSATVRARIAKGFSPVEILKGKEKKVSIANKTAKQKAKAKQAKEDTKVTMTAEELIAGLEKERDEYVAERDAMEAEVVNSELEETSIAA